MINLARKFFQLSAFCQTFVHTEHTSYTAARFYAKFNNVTAPPSFSCTSTVTNLFQPPLSLRFPFFRAGMAVSVRAGNSVAVIQGASDAYVPSVRKIHHFLYLISELFKPVRKKIGPWIKTNDLTHPLSQIPGYSTEWRPQFRSNP